VQRLRGVPVQRGKIRGRSDSQTGANREFNSMLKGTWGVRIKLNDDLGIYSQEGGWCQGNKGEVIPLKQKTILLK